MDEFDIQSEATDGLIDDGYDVYNMMNYEKEFNSRKDDPLITNSPTSFQVVTTPNASPSIEVLEESVASRNRHLKESYDIMTRDYVFVEPIPTNYNHIPTVNVVVNSPRAHHQHNRNIRYELDIASNEDDVNSGKVSDQLLVSNDYIAQCKKCIEDGYHSIAGGDSILSAMGASKPPPFLEQLSCTTQRDTSDLLLSDYVIQEDFTSDNLLFTPKSLYFKFFDQIEEPLEKIYCSFTIYEYSGTDFYKVTETYNFPFGPDDNSNALNRALINLHGIYTNMVVLMKLSRRYAGEYNEVFNDLYTQQKVKEKDIKLAKSKLEKVNELEPKAYSHFCWTAFSLKEAIAASEVSHLFLLPNGNTSDATLLQNFLLAESKKYKPMEGTIRYSLIDLSTVEKPERTVDERVREIVTNQIENADDLVGGFALMTNTRGTAGLSAATTAKVLSDNLTVEDVLQSITRIRSAKISTKILSVDNTLLLQLVSANLPKEYKNLQVEVSLQPDDTDLTNSGSVSLYDSIPQTSPSKLSKSVKSHVPLGAAPLEFATEIKMNVPLSLTENENILFKIFSVNAKEADIKKAGTTKKLVAYTFLKLLSNGTLREGHIDLPVFKIDPSDTGVVYFQNPSARIPSSSLKIHIVNRSFTYPSGSKGNLQEFMRFMNQQDYTQTNAVQLSICAESIIQIPISLGRYIPLVFNELFKIIEESSNGEVQYIAFHTIMRLMQRFCAEDISVILAYVKYHFRPENYDLFKVLRLMKEFAEKKDGFEIQTIWTCSWVYLSLILKAVLINPELHAKSPQTEQFYDSLEDLLVNSFSVVLSANTALNLRHISAEMGSMMQCMLQKVNNCIILPIAARIHQMLSTLPEQVTLDHQMIYLYHMLFKGHMPSMCLPLTVEHAVALSDDTMYGERLAFVSHNHFIYSAFADTIIKSLVQPENDTRTKALSLLYEFLVTHNYDPRYQAPEAKERIHQIHFEFIHKFLDVISVWKTSCNAKKKAISIALAKLQQKLDDLNSRRNTLLRRSTTVRHSVAYNNQVAEIERMKGELLRLIEKNLNELKTETARSKHEKCQLIICILHIIDNVNSQLLSKWFSVGISDSKRSAFLELLQLTILSTEYEGKAEIQVEQNRRLHIKSLTYREIRDLKQSNTLNSLSFKIESSIDRLKVMAEDVSRSKSLLGIVSSAESEDDFIPRVPSTDLSFMTPTQLRKQRMSVVNVPPKEETKISLSMLSDVSIPAELNYFTLSLLSSLEVEMDHNCSNEQSKRLFLEGACKTLLYFMHTIQCERFLLDLVAYSRAFFQKHASIMCSPSSEFAPLFCEALFSLSNSRLSKVRAQARVSIYFLIRSAFAVSANNVWPQVMSVLALSRMLQQISSTQMLTASLVAVDQLAKSDKSVDPSVTEEIVKLFSQLQNLVSDTHQILMGMQGADHHESEQLLYDISEVYERIPELKVMWLKRLAQFHADRDQKVEAAHVYCRVIAIVIESLQRNNKDAFSHLPLSLFYSISPFLQNYRDLHRPHWKLDNLVPRGPDFTEKGLFSLMRTAVTYFDGAEHFESSVALLRILQAKFEADRDTDGLATTYTALGKTYQGMNQCGTRQPNTYYQLTFIGDEWGESAGKQYIYKMPKLYKLYMMTQNVKKIYGDIEILSSKADTSSLDPTKRYLQVTNVRIYNSKDTTTESYCSPISQFYYEVAFTPDSNKLSENVTEIHKRKTILTVENSFPDVRTRLGIVKEEEIVLTPIEAAIENIESQVSKLEDALDLSHAADTSGLQLVLQGSVRAGVNGGPSDIVHSFLDRHERGKYNPDHVKRLNDQCYYFLCLCEQAILVDAKYVRLYKKNMHSELEKGFADIKHMFTDYVEADPRYESMASAKYKPKLATSSISALQEVGYDIKLVDDILANGLPPNRHYSMLLQTGH